MVDMTPLKRFFVCCLIFFFTASFLFAEEEAQERQKGKSPLTALALGIAVPGGGDFYASKPLKGALFLALGGFFGYQAYRHWKESEDYYGLYEKSSSERDYARYEESYDKAQSYFYYYLINLAVSVLDGFVEASLSDWAVENVHIEQIPAEDGRMALTLKKEF